MLIVIEIMPKTYLVVALIKEKNKTLLKLKFLNPELGRASMMCQTNCQLIIFCIQLFSMPWWQKLYFLPETRFNLNSILRVWLLWVTSRVRWANWMDNGIQYFLNNFKSSESNDKPSHSIKQKFRMKFDHNLMI